MASSKNVLKEILPEVLAARDILERDEEARRIDREEAAYADALRKQPKNPPELHRPLPSEPVEIRAKNVLTDPKSWLNTGLRNLAGNAASVILGEPSGNDLVDLGAANVPGVGAGAILAAGGTPGIVDVMPGGTEIKNIMKGLKHAGKIGEKTAAFILRNFDEDALRAVDNYIGRFPKVNTIQAPDAYKILTEGRAGEMYLPKSISSDEAYNRMLAFGNGMTLPKLVESIAPQLSDDVAQELMKYAGGAQDAVRRYVDHGDMIGALALEESLLNAFKSRDTNILMDALKTASQGGLPVEAASTVGAMREVVGRNRAYFDLDRLDSRVKDAGQYLNDYVSMQAGVAQNLEDIEAKQLRNEANRAQKEARKAQKNAARQSTPVKVERAARSAETAQSASREADLAKTEADRARYMRNLEKRAEQNRATTQAQQAEAAARAEAAASREIPEAAEAVTGGPGKWRENGWTPEGHPITEPGMNYYILGKDATDEDRRAFYALDSLAGVHAADILRNAAFKDEWPGREVVRHRGTNYDAKSADFGRDVAWNIRTGNIPANTKKIVLKDAVSTAGNRLPGQKTGILDGKDLYDLLFRRKSDRRINELDSRYNIDLLNY